MIEHTGENCNCPGNGALTVNGSSATLLFTLIGMQESEDHRLQTLAIRSNDMQNTWYTIPCLTDDRFCMLKHAEL
jgi:hypothetical protein